MEVNRIDVRGLSDYRLLATDYWEQSMQCLGIDAGGTRTRLVAIGEADLQDAEAIGQEHFLGPGNFRQLGEPGVRRLVRDIAASLDERDPSDTRVLAGFAGAGTAESHGIIRSIFLDAGYRQVTVTSDAGLMMLTLRNNGVVLSAGTGAICMGRRPRSNDPADCVEARAGGYGYRIASEPGGYALGIRAIDAGLRIADGRRQEPTVLTDIVGHHLGLSDLRQIAPVLYPAGHSSDSVQPKVAGLAPLVLRAAADGDPVARAIVSDVVDQMADHIRAVCDRLGLLEAVIGLHGGLFATPDSDRLLIRPLRSHPDLVDLPLTYRGLGLRDGDPDPLLAAMRFELELSDAT